MTSQSIIVKYPFDPTAQNPENRVLSEPHILPGGDNRAIVPNYGAFYADTLIVREQDSGQALERGRQYQAVHLITDASEKTGREVMSVIIVTDANVSPRVTIECQMVGGRYSNIVPAIQRMLGNLNLEERPVRWGDVLGKPNAFPPTPHLHDIGDVYGFEYLVQSINSLTHAVAVGQEGALNELRQYIEIIESRVDVDLTQMSQAIDDVEDFAHDKRQVIHERIDKLNQDVADFIAARVAKDQSQDAQRQALQNAFDAFKVSVQDDIAQANQRITAVKNNLQDAIDAYTEAFDNHIEDFNSLANDFNDLTSSFDQHLLSYAEHLSAFDSFKTSTTQNLNSLNSDVSSVSSMVDALDEALDNFIDEVGDDFEAVNNALSQRLTQAQSDARYYRRQDVNNLLDNYYTRAQANDRYYTKTAADQRFLRSIPSSYKTQGQNDNRYARINGNSSERFSVAKATSSTHAPRIGQVIMRRERASGRLDLSNIDAGNSSDFTTIYDEWIDTGLGFGSRSSQGKYLFEIYPEPQGSGFEMRADNDKVDQQGIILSGELEFRRGYWNWAGSGIFLRIKVQAKRTIETGGSFGVRWRILEMGYNYF